MTASEPAPYSLLTFAPMVDSETCRFILKHYGISYRERPHAFAWGSLLGLTHVGTVRVPAFYGGGLRFAGPRPLVDYFDQRCPVERMLVPSQQPLHLAIEAGWDLYNGQLAAHTAVLAYYHLLPHREIMMEPFFRGVPAAEAAALRPAYPLLRGLLTLLLQLSKAKAGDALLHIRLIFDETDARIADRRRYLAGDRVTLADLALAAAAAPLLLPDGYGAPIPPLERMPAELAGIVRELRQRPTAAFVQRIYNEHYH